MGIRVSVVVLLGFVGLVVAGCAAEDDVGTFGAADRLEIINVLNSYPHTIDHGLVDDYVGLFTEDAVFEINYPGMPRVTVSGHEQLAPLAEGARERLQNGIQRRHQLTNIVFHEQAETSARVSCYLLLSSTAEQSDLTLDFTGQYDGRLVKGEEGWKISKWVLTSDSGIAVPTATEES